MINACLIGSKGPPSLKLRIAHLYPDLLNIYGDRGNVLTLYQRCFWRGIEVTVTPIDTGAKINPDDFDLYFAGGGQDLQQIRVCEDLHQYKADGLKIAAEQGAVFLTICGGYQLLGHYYKPHKGPELKGLSLIDAYTIAGHNRMIGNITIQRPNGTLVVGFENHSGLTYLGEGVQPLGKVITGYGNNGRDKGEGVQMENLYGSYLHGSLLPKNPELADELITKALNFRYGAVELSPLNDTLEHEAKAVAMKLKS